MQHFAKLHKMYTNFNQYIVSTRILSTPSGYSLINGTQLINKHMWSVCFCSIHLWDRLHLQYQTRLLGLNVSLFPHSLGHLLQLKVFLFGLGQILHWILELRLDPTQLLNALWAATAGEQREKMLENYSTGQIRPKDRGPRLVPFSAAVLCRGVRFWRGPKSRSCSSRRHWDETGSPARCLQDKLSTLHTHSYSKTKHAY